MDQPLCTDYTGGACGVNLLTEELGIQVEEVIGPAHSPSKKITPIARQMLVHGVSIYLWTMPLKSDSRTIPVEVMSVKS